MRVVSWFTSTVHGYQLLRLLLLFTLSCQGQGKTNLTEHSRREAKTSSAGHPKIRKTQGTNHFANIQCGVTDKAGNLWFGTTGEGVYRYDGKLFTQFTKEDGLSSNTVWSILADKVGNIWFGTDAGLRRYDGKTITSIPIAVTNSLFSPAAISPMNRSSATSEVWSMMQDRSGKLWLGTSEGVYCYDGTTFTRFLDNHRISNPAGLQLKMVDCLLEDKQGIIWFASGMPPGMEGICRYDRRALTHFKLGGDGWIRYLLEDKTGTIWSGGSHQGVWRYDGQTFTQFIKGGNANGLASVEDKAGHIWLSGGENKNGFGGDGGIWRYDGKGLTNVGPKDGLGDYGVWCLVVDRAGQLWAGTRNLGLYRYDGKRFTSFTEQASTP